MIPGVLSARALGDGVEFTEIHILSDSDRHPKQIARDVESCLAAKFGLTIDHRRISVAQIDPKDRDQRFAIESIQIRLQGRISQAEVVLKLGSANFVGKADGPVSVRHRLMLPAQATADAVAQALGDDAHIVVEDVGRFDVAGTPAIVSIVTLTAGREEETLVGAAFVKRDELEATVRAALSGLNRRIGILLEEAPSPI